MKRDQENYLIQSVSHALDILESFTKTDDELGVTELSKRLGLHKNNVFRLLATLEHRGYIEQNRDTENYRLGAKTLQIGCTYIDQRECRRQARPILEKRPEYAGLRKEKEEILRFFEKGRVSIDAEKTGELMKRFQEFREKYMHAYSEAHCRSRSGEQFAPYEKVRQSRRYQVLTRLVSWR